jgi:hypothetical protein
MLIHDALVEYLLSHDTEVRNGEINKYIQNLCKIPDDKTSWYFYYANGIYIT